MDAIKSSEVKNESQVDLMGDINQRVGEVFEIPSLNADQEGVSSFNQPRLTHLKDFIDRLDTYQQSSGYSFEPQLESSKGNMEKLSDLSDSLAELEFEEKHGFSIDLNVSSAQHAVVSFSRDEETIVELKIPYGHDYAELQLDIDPLEMDPKRPVSIHERPIQVEATFLDAEELKTPPGFNGDGVEQLKELLSERLFIPEDSTTFAKITDDLVMTEDMLKTATILHALNNEPEIIKDIADDLDYFVNQGVEVKPRDHAESPSLEM